MEFGIRLLAACLSFALSSHITESGVTYDNRAILINGQRRILLSGSIHYPRSTPDMWEGLILKAKRGGLDAIDTYVFWNLHEPSRELYDFEGNNDLVRFLKTVQKAGLYVHLRIGPYVCAEWNFGGFPVWLKYIPGIAFRTDNEPFKREMQRFTETVVDLMKSERLFASQGGPIILSQIENEYGKLASRLGQEGKNYMRWAVKMAVELNTGVPWVMCKEEDAPDPVINTCNGFYCDGFIPNRPYKPSMWTEAWSGWFGRYGSANRVRPVEDLAFAVAQFIQKGGSFINYYMYHGGTNFGRASGGPFITTSYDYDAPLDEYGMAREPKFSHLRYLHLSIKMCEKALVSTNSLIRSLGDLQQVYVYDSDVGGCAAFISNRDMNSTVQVLFNKRHHTLPPHSITILPDCRNAVFNTAKVGVQTFQMEMVGTGDEILSWEMYEEDVVSEDDRGSFSFMGLLDHVNVTRDFTDYLWYRTSVGVSESELVEAQRHPVLTVDSSSHALHVFVNGKFIGSAFGTGESPRRLMTFTKMIPNLRAGNNRIALLSVMVGLPNSGMHFESWATGVHSVTLDGLNRHRDLSRRQEWSYEVGLRGEAMNLVVPREHPSSYSSDWAREAVEEHVSPRRRRGPVWYRALLKAPVGDAPVALDMGSMGKGQVWINGQSIGRYWLASAVGTCPNFTYSETYRHQKFQVGCGGATQRLYHVPRSWLRSAGNLLVVLEEVGGDPHAIRLVTRRVGAACATVSEYHPEFAGVHAREPGSGRSNPKVRIRCGPHQSITWISFASFGTPFGACGSFARGSCHSPSSLDVVRLNCVGRRACSVPVSVEAFSGQDPCPGLQKRLAVEAVCT